jgi:hypothetical protein
MTYPWGALGLVLLVLLTGIACDESQNDPPGLTGTWVMELRLDRSEFRDRPIAGHVGGAITLAAEAVGGTGRQLNGTPATHSGRTRLDLRPFGFGERPWENVGSTTIMGDVAQQADVALASSGPDGVHILVNPAVSHGGLAFDGRWRGSWVKGTWFMRGFVPMASGTFEMHRER